MYCTWLPEFCPTFTFFRYIMSEQKKADDFGITEDDVSEIRQDINKFRFELVDILSRNNFDIGKVRLNGKL